jgi:hypothetical protein
MQRCSATGGLFHINSMLSNQQKPFGCMAPQLHQSPQWSSLFAWFYCSTCAAAAGLQGELLARHLCVTVSQGSGGPRSSSSLSCTCTCITIHFSVDRHGSFSLCDLITTGLQGVGVTRCQPGGVCTDAWPHVPHRMPKAGWLHRWAQQVLSLCRQSAAEAVP